MDKGKKIRIFNAGILVMAAHIAICVVIALFTKGIAISFALLIMLFLALMIAMFYGLNKTKKETQPTRLEDRYPLLLQEEGSAVFEIDFKNDTAEATQEFEKIFGVPVREWRQAGRGKVHPKDEQALSDLFQGVFLGEKVQKKEIRILDEDGGYGLIKIYISTRLDKDNKPISVLGRAEKIRTPGDVARKKITKDTLTDIYDKETLCYLIDRYLHGEGAKGFHGLMLINGDDFEKVNIENGREYGDLALVTIAEKLTAHFRRTDVIGRLGNDEFVVLLKNIDNLKQLEKQVKSLINALCAETDAFTLKPSVTCSVGAAFNNGEVQMCDDLINKARQALILAKNKGKNRGVVYQED